MNRPILCSLLLGVTAIAGAAEAARAQCLSSDGNFVLQRDRAPSNSSFVSASPASSDTEFKFELELGSDVNIFAPDSAEVETAATGVPATATDDGNAPAATETTTEAPPDSSTAFSLDADSSAAADLDTVELEAQPLMSREEYLDSQASEINDCF